jgi:Protein of unknown function (DUF1559)
MKSSPRESVGAWQFGLPLVFEIVLGVSLACALVVRGGAVFAGIGAAALGVGLFLARSSSRHERNDRRFVLMVIGLSAAVATCCLSPSVRSGPASPSSTCANNLHQLGVAMHNYHALHGCFPPASVTGPDGRPWHSWRTLILPFVEMETLYGLLDFAEPWNGPKNRTLTATQISTYQCPADEGLPANQSSYCLVTGPGRLASGSQVLRSSDVTDGLANTILVIDGATERPWAAPGDVTIDELLSKTDAEGNVLLPGAHSVVRDFFWEGDGMALVLCADGASRRIPARMPKKVLHALLTIDGGESVDWGTVDWYARYTRSRKDPVRWSNLLLLVASAAYVVATTCWHWRRLPAANSRTAGAMTSTALKRRSATAMPGRRRDPIAG